MKWKIFFVNRSCRRSIFQSWQRINVRVGGWTMDRRGWIDRGRPHLIRSCWTVRTTPVDPLGRGSPDAVQTGPKRSKSRLQTASGDPLQTVRRGSPDAVRRTILDRFGPQNRGRTPHPGTPSPGGGGPRMRARTSFWVPNWLPRPRETKNWSRRSKFGEKNRSFFWKFFFSLHPKSFQWNVFWCGTFRPHFVPSRHVPTKHFLQKCFLSSLRFVRQKYFSFLKYFFLPHFVPRNFFSRGEKNLFITVWWTKFFYPLRDLNFEPRIKHRWGDVCSRNEIILQNKKIMNVVITKVICKNKYEW